MRNSILMAAAAALMTLGLSQIASAMPAVGSNALKAAAEAISPAETSGYGHRRHHYGYRHHYRRHHHHYHRRHY